MTQPALEATRFWRGKRVFITGHTGFKGSWLSLWLVRLGADVRGYALPPNTTPNMFDALCIAELVDHVVGDVRNAATLAQSLADYRPEVVFHLAAQPLVRESYRTPIETYATNVMGTAHVLEAVRGVDSVKSVVIVTTDKCYENREWVWGYRETDRLGGHDPYSSSKACAEIVTAAYRSSFFAQHQSTTVAVASARAGNVLGGGDWSADRLVPDAVRSITNNEAVAIRRPWSTRPWQHVLEPLAGYLMLGEKSAEEPARFSDAWNFGPPEADVVEVSGVIEELTSMWGAGAKWVDVSGNDSGPHEAGILKLDASKASAMLGWHPRWDLAGCLSRTVDWYKAFYRKETAEQLRSLTFAQIEEFEASPARS